MRRRIRRKNQKSKQIIIISTMCLLFCLCVGYAAFQTNIIITAKGNILKQDRVIQSWDNTSNEDFHSEYYRENIVSVTFLDNNNIPSNAVESWNVSEDKDKGGVMAWVVRNNTDNTKYDLYIGANKGVIANEESNYLFFYFPALTSIDFGDNFDTSNAVTMESMFMDCVSLTEIDLSSFDTSNVVDMSNLFTMWDYRDSTSALTKIDLSGFKTTNVTNMKDMFAYNPNLITIIGLENFNTSNVTNMQGMFHSDKSLTSLNLSSFDTKKVNNMYSMFHSCSGLTELNLCSWDTSSVTNMQSMFNGTTNLTKIYVGDGWTTTYAKTEEMFAGSGVSVVTPDQC